MTVLGSIGLEVHPIALGTKHASRVEQLPALLAAATLQLSTEQLARLTTVSRSVA